MNNKLLGPLFLFKYIYKSVEFPSFFEECWWCDQRNARNSSSQIFPEMIIFSRTETRLAPEMYHIEQLTAEWKKNTYWKASLHLKEPRASLGYVGENHTSSGFLNGFVCSSGSFPNQILLTVERSSCCQSNEGVKHRQNLLCYTWTLNLYKCTQCIFLNNEHFCI